MNSSTPLDSPKVTGLQSTQISFAQYQSKAFPKRSASFFALELAGEVGELANEEKKIWRDPQRNIDKDRIADEAADVFIALVNYANERGIDLETAVQTKLLEIERRRLSGKMGTAL
jgi:NTP pyrophosphatase (non-canonical NTP hydrolase)